MREFRFTLLSDGSSDEALMPLLSWLLRNQGVSMDLAPQLVKFRGLRKGRKSLADKIEYSLFAYPCDLLFVHRDAEREPADNRKKEIRDALVSVKVEVPPCVCVVPVRMMEAWLLFEERALRQAAGNPNGNVPLSLPRVENLEDLPDPKELLEQLVLQATELTGRRRRNFNTQGIARHVSRHLDDFSRLRSLPAFRALEQDLLELVQKQRWNELR
jgi:hypothetical protein